MSIPPPPPTDTERARIALNKETNSLLREIRVVLWIILGCTAVTACSSCDTAFTSRDIARTIRQAKIY